MWDSGQDEELWRRTSSWGTHAFFFFFAVRSLLLLGRLKFRACFFFAVWAGPGPPPKQQKKKHVPPQTVKKTTTRKAQTTNKTRQQKINTLTAQDEFVEDFAAELRKEVVAVRFPVFCIASACDTATELRCRAVL